MSDNGILSDAIVTQHTVVEPHDSTTALYNAHETTEEFAAPHNYLFREPTIPYDEEFNLGMASQKLLPGKFVTCGVFGQGRSEWIPYLWIVFGVVMILGTLRITWYCKPVQNLEKHIQRELKTTHNNIIMPLCLIFPVFCLVLRNHHVPLLVLTVLMTGLSTWYFPVLVWLVSVLIGIVLAFTLLFGFGFSGIV